MKLCRASDDRQFAGVCGGLAEHLGWDSGKVRIVWVLATLFTAFAGVVIYLALWYLMPEGPAGLKSFEVTDFRPWWKRWV